MPTSAEGFSTLALGCKLRTILYSLRYEQNVAVEGKNYKH
jgi:hypothetical protein